MNSGTNDDKSHNMSRPLFQRPIRLGTCLISATLPDLCQLVKSHRRDLTVPMNSKLQEQTRISENKRQGGKCNSIYFLSFLEREESKGNNYRENGSVEPSARAQAINWPGSLGPSNRKKTIVGTRRRGGVANGCLVNYKRSFTKQQQQNVE